MAEALLSLKGLQAWYGESHVLHGVDFHVDEGEVVTLLGRNGAGRPSTLRAIMGLIGARNMAGYIASKHAVLGLTRVAALDSAKQTHYLPAIMGIQAWFGSTRDCIDAALTGRWNGARP